MTGMGTQASLMEYHHATFHCICVSMNVLFRQSFESDRSPINTGILHWPNSYYLDTVRPPSKRVVLGLLQTSFQGPRNDDV